jgi:subtilisin family serine protease
MTRKLVLILLSTLALSASLFAEERGRYMVVMRHEAPATSLRLVANSAEAIEHRVRRYEHAGSTAMDLTETEAAELRRSPDVETVEHVVLMMAQEVSAPAERVLFEQPAVQTTPWGITAIHAQNVWPVTRGKTVNVAVIDSGIESKHPDLAHAYAGGQNIVDPAKPPEDDFGHGTHVAGIIAAADNNIGTVGVAPEVKLWAVKVLYQDGSGHDDYVVAGLDWLIAKKQQSGGAWVANMSLGGLGTNALAKAVQRALDAGIILVASAGNTGNQSGLLYPAGYEGVISVGAVDSQLHVASFSTHGIGLNVVAPGVNVLSTYLRGKSSLAEVEAAGKKLTGYSVINSPEGTVEAPFINCGYGRPQDIPAAALGRICVIQRSPAAPDAMPFSYKAINAKEAGAVGVILYNDDDTARPDYAKWELWRDEDHQTYTFPLTIAMSYADGVKLLYDFAGPIRMSFGYREYLPLNGTSMAAPHVTGTVALLLALAPNANFATIESVLERSATDIDSPGWDYFSAWGMVDALNAARMMAPASFGGSAGIPPQPPGKRHSTRS